MDIPESVTKLVHELQIYQVELEIQNKELRHSQMELSRSKEYYDLFGFAPIEYFILDSSGVIRE